MRANIKLSLSSKLPVNVLALLDNVLTKLAGNPHFPDPPIALQALTTLRDELKAAIEQATGGSVNARKLRDQKVSEVNDALRVIADHVRSRANGDAVKLSSSGFEMAKRAVPFGVVGVPGRLVASSTDAAGELQLRWGRTIGARMYRVEQASGDPAQGEVSWKMIGLVSRHSFLVSGLAAYTPSWFRITALGIDSEGLPSDVVMGRAA